ncbi:MAG: 3-ketosteroid dehydrogenase [Enterovirga sp.]|nr:3-ketosteroid dehydrogenase [Enterovirga sp.]
MPVRPASEARPEIHVPVVVIGAGACGLTAALTLHGQGTEVLVLERDPRPAGSTSLSAGLIPAAGTRLQRDKGIEDDPDLFASDLAAKAHGENDPEVVRAVAHASGPTIDWLVGEQGLDLHLVEGFTYPGHSRLRMHGPKTQTGADLEAMLLAAAERAGIDILTGASVEDLFADESGRVVAVGARRPDGAEEIVGCEAVVLACNGFGGNPDLVRRHIPEMAEAEYCGHTSNTGDALAWGQALGAAAADLGSYQGHGSVPRPHSAPLTWAVITLGGFQVNAEGLRFANEMRGYSEHAGEVLKQPGRFAWDIYDARCEAPALAFHDYREFKRLGAIKEAGSLSELAAVTGLPEAALAATLAEVKRCGTGAGTDPFGRDFTACRPLAPPYRAAKVTGALFHTQGGLAVDSRARVLRPDGSALPNLLAGGGAARGLSGPSAWGYLSGNGLLSAVVLGRLAGLSAARLVRG